jgi:hypothetical protein
MSKKQEPRKVKQLKTESDITKENKFEVKKIDDFQFKCYVKNITE